MNNLIHQFVTEAHAVLRGHVRAMGGNALLSFTQHEFNIADSHRNQACASPPLSMHACGGEEEVTSEGYDANMFGASYLVAGLRAPHAQRRRL
jgi:hypothetical protein